MQRTVAIVQARMGSQRFPGKSLTPLWNDVTLIEFVLTRVQQSSHLDQVVMATSNLSIDDPLEIVAQSLGVPVFRGDEKDVLKRFCDAVEVFPAQSIVRICGDNPLVDPLEIDKLVEFFRTSQPCDYACNDRMDCGLPDGSGAEIFSLETLMRINTDVTGDLREHVSLYVTQHPDEFEIARLIAAGKLHRPDVRLDVDYESDAEFIRQLLSHLDPSIGPFWATAEIIEALSNNPYLNEIRTDRSEQNVLSSL